MEELTYIYQEVVRRLVLRIDELHGIVGGVIDETSSYYSVNEKIDLYRV